MGGGQMETPARGQAQPGRDGRFATAAGTRKLATRKAKCHTAEMDYTVTPTDGEPFRIVVSGRVQWALDRQAGQPVRLWVLCEASGMA